jgi:hypothetical protein
VQVTGVDTMIASPSMPTGIWGASAVISICVVISALSPVPCVPRSRPTACRALCTLTPTTPRMPQSSRALDQADPLRAIAELTRAQPFGRT